MPLMGNNKPSQPSHSSWKKSLQDFKFLLQIVRKSKLPLAFLGLLFTLTLRVSLTGRMKGTLNSDRLAMKSFTAFPETHLRFMATCLEISWCRNVGQKIKLYFPLSHFSGAQFPFITLYFLTQYVLQSQGYKSENIYGQDYLGCHLCLPAFPCSSQTVSHVKSLPLGLGLDSPVLNRMLSFDYNIFKEFKEHSLMNVLKFPMF